MHHRESDDGNAHVGHDGLTQMRSPKAGKGNGWGGWGGWGWIFLGDEF